MKKSIQKTTTARKSTVAESAQAAMETALRVETVAGLEPWTILQSILGDWVTHTATNPRELVGFIEEGFQVDPATWPEHRAAVEVLAAKLAANHRHPASDPRGAAAPVAPEAAGQPVTVTLTLPAAAHAFLIDMQERTGLTSGDFLESALDAIQQQLESVQARPLAA